MMNNNPWHGLGPLQKALAWLVSRWLKYWRDVLMFALTLGVWLGIVLVVVHIQGEITLVVCFLAPFAAALVLALFTILLEV